MISQGAHQNQSESQLFETLKKFTKAELIELCIIALLTLIRHKEALQDSLNRAQTLNDTNKQSVVLLSNLLQNRQTSFHGSPQIQSPQNLYSGNLIQLNRLLDHEWDLNFNLKLTPRQIIFIGHTIFKYSLNILNISVVVFIFPFLLLILYLLLPGSDFNDILQAIPELWSRIKGGW